MEIFSTLLYYLAFAEKCTPSLTCQLKMVRRSTRMATGDQKRAVVLADFPFWSQFDTLTINDIIKKKLIMMTQIFQVYCNTQEKVDDVSP